MNKALWEFSNTYRRYVTLRRFLEIIGIVAKFFLGNLFRRIKLRRHRSNASNGGMGERVRLLIEELGPTFIKFGQILSTRTECPEALRKELKKLQDMVPPFSYEEVEDIIEEELAAPIEELFSSFNKVPIASASLGQVHEARLRKGRNRGERVAVKVQRPNIESIIEVDLSVLDFFARFIHRFIPRAKIMNVPDIIDAFGTALRKEIDYILEGRNADKVAKIHKNDKTVAVPEIYWDYTSKRVLTMEFIEGIKISEVDEMDRAGLDRYEVTKNMLRAYMKQIFAEGFLHADPHPANLFVLEDEVICFLDFGMVEHLDDPLLDKLTDLLIAAIHDVDPAKTRDEFMRLHVGRREDVDSQRLLFGLASFMDRHFVDKKFPLSQRGVGYIMNDIVYEVYKYGIKLPLPLVLVIKTLLYCEMLANELYPGFDVMDMVKPHVNRRLRGKYRRKVDALGLTEPKDLVSDLLDAAKEAFDFAKDFPRQATAIMNKIERGEMEFKVTNNNHNNHLIWGIAISAIIITLLVVIILQI